MPIRCICFDLGGVILEINHTWGDAALDAEVDILSNHAAHLTALPEFDDYNADDRELGRYLLALREFLGVESQDECLDIHAAIVKGTYPGVIDLIKEIKAAGLTVGCMSNTNALHWDRAIAQQPVMGMFDPKIASHLVGSNKPDAGIYQAFQDASGCGPSEILFFDDWPPNVNAARDRGWNAEQINPQRPTADQMRRHLVGRGVLS